MPADAVLSTPPRRPTCRGRSAALRASGWQSVPVAEELRRNAAARIAAGEPLVAGVLGFEETVIPQLENALLAGHDVILLGERGQAKTRLIRALVDLLDEWLPVVAGSEINDDPYQPTSRFARLRVAEEGDETPIELACTGPTATARSWPPPTPPSPTSSARSTRSRWPRAGTSPTSWPCTTAWCPGSTAASSPSTSCPTWPSGSRSACSTCSRSATSRSAATGSGSRSTSCWWPRPTPRTTPTGVASSPR